MHLNCSIQIYYMLLGTYIWGDSGVKIINFLLMFYDNSYYYSFALNKQLSYHWKLDILWVFNYHSGCKLPFQKSLKTGYFFTFAYHSGCKNPDFFGQIVAVNWNHSCSSTDRMYSQVHALKCQAQSNWTCKIGQNHYFTKYVLSHLSILNKIDA